jgi:DNA-binding response OmpR family regulator
MGAHDVLRKPFNCEEFVMVLTLTLNTYDLPREVHTPANDGTSQQAA